MTTADATTDAKPTTTHTASADLFTGLPAFKPCQSAQVEDDHGHSHQAEHQQHESLDVVAADDRFEPHSLQISFNIRRQMTSMQIAAGRRKNIHQHEIWSGNSHQGTQKYSALQKLHLGFALYPLHEA